MAVDSIDIVDPAARKLIWRGSAQADLNRNPSTEEKQGKVDAAVEKILKRFPPDQKNKAPMRRPASCLPTTTGSSVEGLVDFLSPTCDLVGTVGDGRALVEAAI